jgi:hypothetical protein
VDDYRQSLIQAGASLVINNVCELTPDLIAALESGLS